MKKKIKIDYLLYAILFLLPFVHVNIGINVSDQGYNLANFASFSNINDTWKIATLVANLVGKLLTYMPFGDYMLGMNIYCTLLLSLSVVGIFYILKKDYSKYAVFSGLVLAICLSWSPKVTLYQYLSYYLLSFATLILVKGLHGNKKTYLFGAGIILGINMFVRFPNILELILIVVVIYASVLCKKKVKDACMDCICCIAGYAIITVLGIFLIDVIYGSGTYLSMINGLFGMTDTATSYSAVYMLKSVWDMYVENWKWFRWFLALAVLGTAIGGFLKKKWMRYISYVIYMMLFGVILRILWYYGKINISYTSYASIHTISAVFMIFAIIILICTMMLPRIDVKKRLYAISALLIIVITPLGSNNVLYTNYNNLYIVAPVVLGSVPILLKNALCAERKCVWVFDSKPLKIVAYSLVAVVMFQAFVFNIFFIYGGTGLLNESRARVDEVSVLRGMRTSEENAEMLSGLSDFIIEEGLTSQKYIVFSNAPLLYYILDLEGAIGHTWPALDSYPLSEYVEDIEQMDTYPIVIYETRYFEDMFTLALEENTKIYYIQNLLTDGNYVEVYRNEHYAVCIPEIY